MKRLRSYKFHSRFLIPCEVIDKVGEDIDDRRDAAGVWQYGNEGHFFKEGDCVYHVDELMTRIRVDKVLREYDKEGKSRMIGLQCHWWEDVEAPLI